MDKMKKIIALLLAVCCLFAVVACRDDKTPDVEVDTVQVKVDEISLLFDTLVPTQSVTTTKLTFGVVTLETVETLVTGTVDGADASVLTVVNETLSDVKGGGSLIIKNTENRWFVDGRGVSVNKGKTWDAEGTDFAPTPGSIKLNLAKEYLATKEYDEQTQTLTVTVAKDNVANVLGSFTPETATESDVTIAIATAGGRIVSIEVSYVVPEKTITYAPDPDFPEDTEKMQVPDVQVVVRAEYTYDYQLITMN